MKHRKFAYRSELNKGVYDANAKEIVSHPSVLLHCITKASERKTQSNICSFFLLRRQNLPQFICIFTLTIFKGTKWM